MRRRLSAIAGSLTPEDRLVQRVDGVVLVLVLWPGRRRTSCSTVLIMIAFMPGWTLRSWSSRYDAREAIFRSRSPSLLIQQPEQVGLAPGFLSRRRPTRSPGPGPRVLNLVAAPHLEELDDAEVRVLEPVRMPKPPGVPW